MKLANRILMHSLMVLVCLVVTIYVIYRNSIGGIGTQMLFVSAIGMALYTLLVFFMVRRSIAKPVTFLINAARDLSNGDFNIHLPGGRQDEIGTLTDIIIELIKTVNGLTDEMEYVAVAQSEGVSSTLMGEGAYKGRYREIAGLLNKMITEQNDIADSAIGCVFEVGSGNFSASVRKFPGDKVKLNETIEVLRNNLFGVHSEISRLVNDAACGNLASRADGSRFTGDWETLMAELNSLLEAVTDPINETVTVLGKISMGDFSVSMEGDYKGSYKEIQGSVNKTVSDIGSYISEISSVLALISSGDFRVRINNAYMGEFRHLKDSINSITGQLSQIMGGLRLAAGQITSGARQISDSSQALANGSMSQSDAVDELNNITAELMAIINGSSENVKDANALSDDVDKAAAMSGKEMDQLLFAMGEIRSSSENIASILRAIDDIAAQTNLLALNAAVEAARAGEHGKGFNVVADEVRTLSNRSQKAVQESKQLIIVSGEKVGVGSNAAKAASETLGRISELISSVSSSITNIAHLSERQSAMMCKVTDSVVDIHKVAMANSGMSQEFAATAQELSAQADMLYNTLDNFKL